MQTYDAIIIGSGQAGFPLAGALTDKGWKVALAEGGRIGGTCINYGCSPTKTIIASAHAVHQARRAADYGFSTGPISVDLAAVMARKDRVVERFHGGGENWLTSIPNLTIYRGFAAFESPNQVRVGDDVLQSDRIYINTGTRPTPPEIPGLASAGYLTNVTALDLKTVPDHLVILGGGYVAVEYAQAFRRFGSQVTIVQRGPQLLSQEDADIAGAALSILEAEGVEVILNAQAEHAGDADGVKLLTVRVDGQTRQVSSSHLMVATGRRPNSDRLGLENAGVQTDGRGYIQVDDHLQTNIPGIWALGDINGQGAFTHTSYNDFEIALDNINGRQRKLSDRILTYGVYLDPPLGRVGMTEKQVRESGRKALVGCKPMSHISRAIERDETQGFMKVLVDAEDKTFLGAAIFGIGGDEIVHAITDLMYTKAPYTVMKNAVHIHPTVSELLPTLLGELQPLA